MTLTAASPLEVAQALASAVEAGTTGLRVSAHPVGQVNPPMAVVQLRRIEYNAGGMGRALPLYVFQVDVVIGNTWGRVAWEQLEEWLGVETGSVLAAIEADPTLGDVVQSVKCEFAVDITSTVQQDSPYITGAIEVEVHA